LRDPEVRALQGEALGHLRDRLVFHFDRDAIAEGIAALKGDELTIASYHQPGPTYGETYYDLADAAMVSYVFLRGRSDEDFAAASEEFLKGIGRLFVRFLHASHRMIAKGLVELGCAKRLVDRPTEPPAGLM
jgi:hypothetical protein